MEDQRLKAFCLVVEMKSFTRAAEARFMTQSAISHLIKNLEDELGVKLLNRKGKTILLTPVGRVFYKQAKLILGQYKALEDELYSVLNKVKGPLLIGASPTIATYLLPQVFYDFSREYPEVHMHLSVSNTGKIINELSEGSIDIGIVEGPVNDSRILSEKIAEDEIVMIASENNPLTEKGNLTSRDLLSQTFIMPEAGSGTREIIDEYLASLNIDPQKLKIFMTAGNPELIIQMVQSGSGIAFVSKWSAFKSIKGDMVKLLPVGGQKLRRQFRIAFLEQQTLPMAVKTFIDFVKKYKFFIPF
jgi:LysR family transcriptional regulator, transcriptional activator of the cysJI operon